MNLSDGVCLVVFPLWIWWMLRDGLESHKNWCGCSDCKKWRKRKERP